MRGRQGWVLLLLAAVFSMHGLQCAAADSGAPSGAHATIHAGSVAAPDAVLHAVAPGARPASTGHVTAQPLIAAATATVVAPLGAEFDRMFLEMMIEHHTGAVDMAVAESGEGQSSGAIAMAESIRDTQNAEIAEMGQLLTELGS